ncbi:MAG: hypothetical protein JSR37_02335 [Verrucomicrobia bacterium]|nr:hypothetical protein [Verrucomicrobiota bacterium]MBS0637022.1 hypothetical protein [Verrucomicrobiota bacterium]
MIILQGSYSITQFFDADEIAIGSLVDPAKLSPVELAGLKVEEVASPVLQESHSKFMVAQNKYEKGRIVAEEKDATTAEFYKKSFKIKDHFPLGTWRILQWLFGMKFIEKTALHEKTHFARKLWLMSVSLDETKRLAKLKAAMRSEYEVACVAIGKHDDMPKVKAELEEVYKKLFNEELK